MPEIQSPQDVIPLFSLRKYTKANPYQVPELFERIDSYVVRPLTTLAVKLTVLIFIRSSELDFARCDEIDFDNAMWTIPAERELIEGINRMNCIHEFILL